MISIKIFTQLMTGCAGHFDLLINCPEDFTVTFNFSTVASDLPDIFVLQVNDSITSHHMVLSSMYAPVQVDQSASEMKARTKRQMSQEDDNRKNYAALWQPLFVILGIGLVAFVILIIAYDYVNRKARTSDDILSSSAEESSTPEPESVALNNQGEKQNYTGTTTIPSPPSPPKTKWYISLFAILYIVYSIVFTFSLTFLIVYMAHSTFWGNNLRTELSGSELQRNVNKSILEIKNHESAERSRLFSSFNERREACLQHLRADNRKLLQDYQITTQNQMDAIFMKNGALHILSNKIQKHNVSVYMDQISGFVSDCNKTVHSIVDRFEANYLDFLKKTVTNKWLKIPRQIFLVQDGADPDVRNLMTIQVKQFAAWLEIDKVGELLAVKDNVNHR